MDEFKQAEKLLRAQPLPEDIIEQLDKLRATVPAKLRELFDYYYEAAEAAS